MTTDITKFDEVGGEIAECEVLNQKLVFDYADPKGNKNARSHVYGLRKVKTQINDAHKLAKADALAACQAIDKKRRDYIGRVDAMIEVHDAPLREIEEKEERERRAKIKAEEEARQAAEKAKQEELAAKEADLARREAEHAAKEATFKSEQEEAERTAREMRFAEQQASQAKAEAETKAKAEEAECERKAKDEKHREEIGIEISQHLDLVIENGQITCKVFAAIRDGKIPHVTINY